MSLKIRPATEADLAEIQSVTARAFAKSPLTKLLYPNGQSEEGKAKRLAENHETFRKPYVVTYVAEDTAAGAIVGGAKWHLFREERPESEWNKPYESTPIGPDGDQAIMDAFFKQLHDGRVRLLKGSPCLLLDRLEVLPEYQGRGIGAMLMQWGTDLADEAGLPMYVESSKAGYKLYYKFGFRDTSSIDVDLAAIGKEGGRLQYPIMQRPAQQNPSSTAPS